MSDDFYVTLSSNDGGAYYESNTLTHFRNKLPETIHLQEGQRWEVGLVECILPFNWYHIGHGDERILATKRVYGGGVVAASQSNTAKMPRGRYKDAKHFVNLFKSQLDKFTLGDGFPVSFDARSQQAKLKVPQVSSLFLSRRMMAILNFDEKADTIEKHSDGRFELKTGEYESQGSVDLAGGLHTLWVYSDIAEHHIVAEKKLPLLRILTAEDKTSMEYKHVTFEDVHYFPVRQTLFESIEIDIRDNQGFPVPFEAGEAVITLHFRQRR